MRLHRMCMSWWLLTLLLLYIISLQRHKLQLLSQVSKPEAEVSISQDTDFNVTHAIINYYEDDFRSRNESNEWIFIAMIVCGGDNQSDTDLLEKPLTLIKSALISAKVSEAKHLEFHIFTDSWNLTADLRRNVTVFQEIMKDYVQVSAYYHSVYRAVPEGYERDIIGNWKVCGFVRLFFPHFFPESLKQVLYLDTDTIITGNIKKIWNNFMEKVALRNSTWRTPLAAMVQNDVEDTKYMSVYRENFEGIPHVPPRGVNSGVMFMNLDAMRKYNWTELAIHTLTNRPKNVKRDQQVINLIFHDRLDKLVIFPCQYNFHYLYCEKGLSCKSITDEEGIQIMHGAGRSFIYWWSTHYQLYQSFKSFDLKNHEEVSNLLFKPVRKYYSQIKIRMKTSCLGKIGKYIFKGLNED